MFFLSFHTLKMLLNCPLTCIVSELKSEAILIFVLPMHCVSLIWLLSFKLLLWNNYRFPRSCKNISEVTCTQNPAVGASYIILVQSQNQETDISEMCIVWCHFIICVHYWATKIQKYFITTLHSDCHTPLPFSRDP